MESPRPELFASEALPKSREQSGLRRRRIVIVGAAGRDFHNFNIVYRDDPTVEVVAFTAAQIADIDGRRYPPSLAGRLYSAGIPILKEAELEGLCRAHSVDEVVFAYSDVPHEHLMHMASRALAAGADFTLLGPKRTMLHSSLPVIAITAVRTGCGKSAIARWLSHRLRQRGLRVAVMRHPMPYGDLAKQRAQRFASIADLDSAQCTAEEREEYEPHIMVGNVVFAGVDYAEVLRMAESEADIIVWDGGNNDFPFVKPDLHITVADALRPRQISTHHPGEAVARMADVLVINKTDSAPSSDVELAEQGLRAINSVAVVVRAASPIQLDDASAVKGKRVLVVEDGPPPSPTAVCPMALAMWRPLRREPMWSIPGCPQLPVYLKYSKHIRISARCCLRSATAPLSWPRCKRRSMTPHVDAVVSATPADLAHLLNLNKQVVRARYRVRRGGRAQAFLDRRRLC